MFYDTITPIMLLVIPMAGTGQRFKEAGFTTPKPFISVRGAWMVEWALKSFNLSAFSAIIFLVLKEHDEQFDAVKKLKEKYGERTKCVVIGQVTEGAACTVLLAKEYINTDEDLVIKDSDGYIVSEIHTTINQKRESGIDGILSTVTIAEGNQYSFARTGKDGCVAEVAERKRISDQVITGMYYFRRGRDFVTYATRMIQENKCVNGEFYIAPIYQEMLGDGKCIVTDSVKALFDLGTPEKLAYFLKNYRE